MKDAFGGEIIIGNLYCNIKRSSGNVNVYIGEILRINAKTVTMKVLKQGTALYNDDIKEYGSEGYQRWPKNNVALMSNALIPFRCDNMELINQVINW